MANKRWNIDGKKYELLFNPFNGKEDCVLSFCQDIEDPTCFWYASEDMKVEYDCEFAGSIEEIKELFEEMYADHLQDKVSYYEELLGKWEET